MLRSVVPPLLLALAAPAAAGPGSEAMGLAITQITVRERVIVRVPLAPSVRQKALPTPTKWKEKKGPKCVAVANLAGALMTSPTVIDLVLKGGQRVRAKLDRECRTVNFYSGFYLRPSADGQVCADRDAIRVRSGASCDIDTFKALVAAK